MLLLYFFELELKILSITGRIKKHFLLHLIYLSLDYNEHNKISNLIIFPTNQKLEQNYDLL